jgi:hypothetical protein
MLQREFDGAIDIMSRAASKQTACGEKQILAGMMSIPRPLRRSSPATRYQTEVAAARESIVSAARNRRQSHECHLQDLCSPV